jgi:hypothetical protein
MGLDQEVVTTLGGRKARSLLKLADSDRLVVHAGVQ